MARARCVLAEAEVALASRELGWPARALDEARATLVEHGDRPNAAYARYLQVRRLLLIGRIDEAERALGEVDPGPFPPASRVVHELVVAGIAMRRLRAKAARAALARAERAARRAGIPALTAEVDERRARPERARRAPDSQVARSGSSCSTKSKRCWRSSTIVVDACRHVVRHEGTVVSLARRPVLFALARALAEAWPGDVPRDALVARAFGSRRADDANRLRLRVAVGRLRVALRRVAGVSATARGFALAPRRARKVVVLAPPVEEEHAALLALLADGASWSSSALALALGTSQRSVQRALDSLAAAGKVESFGRGRARRWMTPPLPGFTTILLLPGPLSID